MDRVMEPISSAEAARAFLDVKGERYVSAMKMQKLVYIAHEDLIVKTGKPFISDTVEAWEDGPVFPGALENARVAAQTRQNAAAKSPYPPPQKNGRRL